MALRTWLARNKRTGVEESTQLPTTFPEVLALVENEGIRDSISSMYGEMETNYGTLETDFNELLSDYEAVIAEMTALKESFVPVEALIEPPLEDVETEPEIELETEPESIPLDGENYLNFLKGR